MLAKAVLLIAIANGEAPCWYVGEGIVGDTKVNVETSCHNSMKVLNSGRQTFNSEVGSESETEL